MEFEIILKNLFWIENSWLRYEEYEAPQTMLQYVKYGYIKLWYNVIRQDWLTKEEPLLIMPYDFRIFLHTCSIWFPQDNLSSTNIPRSFAHETCLISVLLIGSFESWVLRRIPAWFTSFCHLYWHHITYPGLEFVSAIGTNWQSVCILTTSTIDIDPYPNNIPFSTLPPLNQNTWILHRNPRHCWLSLLPG